MSSEESDVDTEETRKLVAAQNRKKKKSGGFQSLGLSPAVFKGIQHKGYKIPTPIQRKTIPIILDGRDVVAMARTGSGKSAAFLLPMFEKLQRHTAQSGARALILSPTRELALQTLKFTKELGKYTGLRAAVLLGGDSINEQFAAMHQNPDILIGTPGRLLHILLEMNIKLNHVQYVVFDEADRLFEMGFAEQLEGVLRKLPDHRQTVLFSATLPKQLLAFAKAGLNDPTLVRLDVDTKISEQLQLSFLLCRAEEKLSTLLHLLQRFISADQQTVVFTATKHHVEYLAQVLEGCSISFSYIYSSLDATARKIQAAQFRARQTLILLVTDVAARGIDIPLLDNVVNFNFPAKPKLFIHRVGRVARAGRSGRAISFVSTDELAHLLDLHLFLGRALKLANESSTADEDGLVGRIPQSVIEDQVSRLRLLHESSADVDSQMRVAERGYSKYLTSRPVASHESIKRSKNLDMSTAAFHPLFIEVLEDEDKGRMQLLQHLKSYKAHTTIFETNSTRKTRAYEVMKTKRNLHSDVIEKRANQRQARSDNCFAAENSSRLAETDSRDIEETFSSVVEGAKSSQPRLGKRKRTKGSENEDGVQVKVKKITAKDENYIPYMPKDYHSEKDLDVRESFEQQASRAVLDLTGDNADDRRVMNNTAKWDRKRKKFVRSDGSTKNQKMIKTESGAWVKASYKKNLYKDWLKKNRGVEDRADSEDEVEASAARKGNKHREDRLQVLGGGRPRGKGFHQLNNKKQKQGSARELKDKDQIFKQRRVKHRREKFQKHQEQKHAKRRAMKGIKRGKNR